MSTPFLLQDALVNEIKALFSTMSFKNVKGEETELNVFAQYLPAKQTDEDGEYFPYAVVRILGGGTSNETDAANCNALIFFGLYDESEDYQGHKDLLNVLRKLETHLLKKRIIDRRYRIEFPFDWSVYQDETTFPYYFGGAQTVWTLPAIRQEVNDV
ncbi:hypothetical protein ABE354_08550 [Brevibacillus laterosporus]|uniref:hypothetical protein n=1 Tax=Brevibacillus laterosporus TaxID=1465 RepID=UPI003D229223